MTMQLFIPITKVDAARRLVYGTIAEEIPDKAAEVFDYESSKPYFETWSEEISKASDGRSVGNLRAMHGQVAAGMLKRIRFDDSAKRVEAVAKIVDDVEWGKVVEGVYTGFSMGGRYVKRWPDKENPELTRYTAEPTEVSLVDNPCIPSARFSVIKADGSVEMRSFRAAAAASSSAVAAQPRQIWDCGTQGHVHLAKVEAVQCMAVDARKADAVPTDSADDAAEDDFDDESSDATTSPTSTAPSQVLWLTIDALKEMLSGGDPSQWTDKDGGPLSNDLQVALEDLFASLDAVESAQETDDDSDAAGSGGSDKNVAIGTLAKMLARRDALHRAELAREFAERDAIYRKATAEQDSAVAKLKAEQAFALAAIECRLAALEAQPVEAKGRLLMIDKGHDLGGPDRTAPEIDPSDTLALIKHAQRNPNRIAFG